MLIDEPQLPSNVLKTLKELGVALTHHSGWLKTFHRILICGGTPSPEDMAEDAHHLCRFGQWYYAVEDDQLLDLALFEEVEKLHISVHERARYLLKLKHDGQDITSEVYDDFINIAYDFRTTVQDLQFTLVSKICAVDHLTGVWNRYAMSYRLTQEHDRISRTGNSCVIAIIDFDHFKNINDQHGHLAGDQVLKTSMEYFVDQIRKYDIIFRYGGEEFLFLLPETGVEEAVEILDRLRKGIKTIDIRFNSSNIDVSISIGVASMHGDISVHNAIELADNALLNAKMAGRDCIQIWN
ncbi:MAG: diguanylate cyclase [Gammaproteobacteria bacterium]|nr:diguanylate cyclase [Gammaproteobacteria bacterium]